MLAHRGGPQRGDPSSMAIAALTAEVVKLRAELEELRTLYVNTTEQASANINIASEDQATANAVTHGQPHDTVKATNLGAFESPANITAPPPQLTPPDIVKATHLGTVETTVNSTARQDQATDNIETHGKPHDTVKDTDLGAVESPSNITTPPPQLTPPDIWKATHLGTVETTVNSTERTANSATRGEGRRSGRGGLVDYYLKDETKPADVAPFEDVLDTTIPLAHDRFARCTPEALDKFKRSYTLQSLLNLNRKSPEFCGVELSNRLDTLRSRLFVKGRG